MKKVDSKLDHHANQCNPNNKAYKDAMDNHPNQLNPNSNLSVPRKLSKEEIAENEAIEQLYYYID